MSIEFHDGGAFAECHYVQYPNGLGQQTIAPTTVSRLEHYHAALAASQGLPNTLLTDSLAMRPQTSRGDPLASSRVPATRAAPSASPLSLTLVSTADRDAKQRAAAAAAGRGGASAIDKEAVQAQTAARTRQALEEALQQRQQPQRAMAEDGFDGRRLGKGGSLVISTAPVSGTSGGGSGDPAPIIRSPTKAPKRSVLEVEAAQRKLVTRPAGESTADEAPSLSAPGGVAVPFAVSSWRNKKNLIIPVEQRLAQQHDDRTSSTSGGLSDRIIDLAVAMKQAERGVNQELQQRATARAAEEERKQAALEEEEMKKAKRLMEENAARLAQQQQQQNRRGETREQRLERLRLERELREREKEQKQRQRQLAKAAARLNMRVEDLEADEALLKALERGADGGTDGTVEGGVHAHRPAKLETTADALLQPSSSSAGGGGGAGSSLKREHGGGENDDDDDGDGEGPGGRRNKKSSFQMFMRPVVSNEGIAREMAALAALDREAGNSAEHAATSGGGGVATDGIRLPEADDDGNNDEDDDDEDGDFVMNKLVHKRQRLL